MKVSAILVLSGTTSPFLIAVISKFKYHLLFKKRRYNLPEYFKVELSLSMKAL